MAAQVCLADPCHISLNICLVLLRVHHTNRKNMPLHRAVHAILSGLHLTAERHHFMHKTVKVSWMLILHSWHGKCIRRDMQLTPDAVKMQTPTTAELLPHFCRSFHSPLFWLVFAHCSIAAFQHLRIQHFSISAYHVCVTPYLPSFHSAWSYSTQNMGSFTLCGLHAKVSGPRDACQCKHSND
jgi:hypothetical protein